MMCLKSINADWLVQTRRDQRLCILSKANTRHGLWVWIKMRNFVPTFCLIDLDIASSNCKISAWPIKCKTVNLKTTNLFKNKYEFDRLLGVIKHQSLQILQLSQIPYLYFSVLRSSCQIIAIFRKRNCSYEVLVSRELRDINLFFYVPNFHNCIFSTRSENQPIGMELSTTNTQRIVISGFDLQIIC